MSAATAQQQPVVPPRPVRSQNDVPRVPPRPTNRHLNNRSVSPNPDRFAPSPLNFGENRFLSNKSPTRQQFSPSNGGMFPPQQHIGRPPSVDLPMVGEEGKEYALLTDEMNESDQASSPEQTRTVGSDMKIHAPKPSLPAVSAKQRVATVTRTDSDRAASFGIGKPSLDEPLAHLASSNRSLKKKASTTSQQSASERMDVEDEHGIPEIGIQVPMYPNAGDVQAPSPAPYASSGAASAPAEGAKRHHKRKGSSRGFEELPPGSYGLHGHGVMSTDKLDQAYYGKHPELAKLEHHQYQADRANDFSMSSEDLNKIVRSTASRGTGLGTHDVPGTPSEQIGWKVTDELSSRAISPRPASAASGREKSSLSKVISNTDNEAAASDEDVMKDIDFIHVDEPNRKRRSVMFSDEEAVAEEEDSYPILADDEVAKNPSPYDHNPAVEVGPERRGSNFEMEEPTSRPTSRPASLYKESSYDEFRSTPLDDVREYEPLFPEDEKAARKEAAKKLEQYKQRFPSRDIWEDAPNSVHYTAEVHTPDVPEQQEEKQPDVPDRSCETPAQKFAREQEELAEKESRGDPEAFHHRKPAKPAAAWAHQAHLAQEVAASRPTSHRFPSRDVWEDTPDSACLSTTVSTPQRESEPEVAESSVPEVPQRPARKQSTEPSSASSDKPAIPERPKPKSSPSDDSLTKPAVSDRPKPQVPARPAKKLSGSDKDTPVGEAQAPEPRSKPAVPARPMGGKIAALQAGFMSDLNKKLGLGPQAPKKEEPAEEEAAAEEKEKAPLVDARKGRARGPQRRAPKASPSPAAKPSQPTASKLSFVMTTTMYSIDPEDGTVRCESGKLSDPAEEEDLEVKKAAAAPAAEKPAPVEEAPVAEKPATEAEKKEDDEPQEKLQTLASNTAGETIVETKLSEPSSSAKDEAVEPIAAVEVAKD